MVEFLMTTEAGYSLVNILSQDIYQKYIRKPSNLPMKLTASSAHDLDKTVADKKIYRKMESG